MKNPKTTIAGILMVVAALATLVSHFLGGGLGAGDVTSLLAAIGGLGLIGAADGGK